VFFNISNAMGLRGLIRLLI